MIEVRYAGAVVGRSAVVRDVDPQGMFLGITEPMPVGTEVTLKVGDQTVAGKVVAVAESQELARAGMRVHFLDASAAALFGIAVEPSSEPAVERAVEPVTAFGVHAPAADTSTAAAVPTASLPSDSVSVTTHEAEAQPPVSPEPSDGQRPPAPDDAEPSGPVATGDGGGGGGSRKNRRNRRR